MGTSKNLILARSMYKFPLPVLEKFPLTLVSRRFFCLGIENFSSPSDKKQVSRSALMMPSSQHNKPHCTELGVDTDTDTLVLPEEEVETETDLPWLVVVLDDPVNLMNYVTMVLMKLFGFNRQKAENKMMEVHQEGRSIVWSGERETAEMYVQQLHSHQLSAILEQSTDE